MPQNLATIPLSDLRKGPGKPQGANRISIQALIIIAVGLLVALAVIIFLIGYVGLHTLQVNVQTTLDDASQGDELSLEFQGNFLQARQAEADFLNRWEDLGFDTAYTQYAQANDQYLASANKTLDELAGIVDRTQDPELAKLAIQINQLRPLIKEYGDAFQTTVATTKERGKPGGLESQMNTTLDALEQATGGIANKTYLELVLQIRIDEQSYLATGRQEFIDNIRLKSLKFENLINNSLSGDLNGSGQTGDQLITGIQSFKTDFDQLVALDQSMQNSTTIFREVTQDINTGTAAMINISEIGLSSAKSRIQAIGNTSTLALLIGSILTLIFVTVGSVIIARRILIPLNQLDQGAERIGQGTYDQPIILNRSSRELDTLAETLNSMSGRVQQTLGELENRVKDRTRDLERRTAQLQFASEIARDASSSRDVDVLLNRAVDLVKERFRFYHAGIFLLDEKGEYAVLQAASGDAGKQMIERGHRLKVGEVGIVGYVTGTGKSRIALDVGADAVHFQNPLLPETRSEMALPLKVGNKVIGALDVQSRDANAFSQDDVNILQIMADQLAVAIDNARLFKEVQENLKQVQGLYGQYGQEAWERLGQAKGILGYRYDSSGTTSLQSDGQEEGLSETGSPISLPLEIRGRSIGSLEIWPQQGGLSSDEVMLLQTLQDRISQAMESARLFEEAQVRAAREQTLSQLTARFTRSIGLDTLLQTAVRELGQLPNVTEVSVHIGTLDQSENE